MRDETPKDKKGDKETQAEEEVKGRLKSCILLPSPRQAFYFLLDIKTDF